MRATGEKLSEEKKRVCKWRPWGCVLKSPTRLKSTHNGLGVPCGIHYGLFQFSRVFTFLGYSVKFYSKFKVGPIHFFRFIDTFAIRLFSRTPFFFPRPSPLKPPPVFHSSPERFRENRFAESPIERIVY